MSFYTLSKRYPPGLVRLLARKNGKAMTNEQIASAAGWTVPKVQFIASKPDWEDVRLKDVKAFTMACGMDFCSVADINRAECYLRKNGCKPTFKYLTKSADWSINYLPLLLSIKPTDEIPQPIRRLLLAVKKI